MYSDLRIKGGQKAQKSKWNFFLKKRVFFLVEGNLGDKFKCQKLKDITI